MLTIDVERSDWPLDELCAFASRDNPKRAFLVVSKILGRHLPTRPAVMRASFRDLAARVPRDVPGPVLVIGMAETAICLGQGVHEELLRQTGRDDLLYLHSTRQILDHPILCKFEEPHSHASSHIVYKPSVLDGEFAQPRSLIIVDDEISTGTTISNLARALVVALPTIETIVAVTLANWSSDSRWALQTARACEIVSLLTGSLKCEAVVRPDVRDRAFDAAAVALGMMHRHHNFGRLGRHDVADDGDWHAEQIHYPPHTRLRVLGTGEFTYPSFRLAELLESRGHDVVIQSTTRSPVQINDVIRSKLEFKDNYGTDVPNYVYNVDPSDDRVTLICHETPLGSIDPSLVELLRAQTIAFGEGM